MGFSAKKRKALAKQPTSITDQINLLKLRGLIIDDETEAKAVLERISYFRLASYWRPMEQDKVLHIWKEVGSNLEGSWK